MDAVLNRKQRATPPVPRIFDGEKEAQLIALARWDRLNLSGVFTRAEFSADYTIGMLGFDFRQGQLGRRPTPKPH